MIQDLNQPLLIQALIIHNYLHQNLWVAAAVAEFPQVETAKVKEKMEKKVKVIPIAIPTRIPIATPIAIPTAIPIAIPIMTLMNKVKKKQKTFPMI